MQGRFGGVCGIALLLAISLFLFLAGCRASASPTCLDEHGNPVDWWIILKVPYLPRSSDYKGAGSGFGYLYGDQRNPSIQLTSKRLDTNLNGALGGTLAQIYNADSSTLGWAMYNDATPDMVEHYDNGHLKGDMAFDANGGFWLLHSVPSFPVSRGNTYYYPYHGAKYGQSFICLSLGARAIETVAQAFLLDKPYIYDSNLPASLQSSFPTFNSLLGGNFITVAGTNVSSITTTGGQSFTLFAKNSEWDNDLWSDLVTPQLRDSLLIETWMNGANSNKMPPFCTPEYRYDNLNVRQLTINSAISWTEPMDHSKWAVSASGSGWICIGDINRQFSQAHRGGGAVCGNLFVVTSSVTRYISGEDSCS